MALVDNVFNGFNQNNSLHTVQSFFARLILLRIARLTRSWDQNGLQSSSHSEIPDSIERGLNVLTLMDITPAFRFGTMACLSGYFVSQSAFGASEHLPLQQGSTIRKLFPSLIYFSTASWSRISAHLKQTSCIFRLLVYGTGTGTYR